MLEIILIIILLPIAIISLILLAFGAFLIWKFILAVLMWLVAGGLFLYSNYVSFDPSMKWWALGFFIAGCLFWAEAGESYSKKPTDQSEIK